MVDKLEEMLDYPEFDPHGDPIPGKDGSIPKIKDSIPLSKVKVGTTGKVIRVNDFDNGFLNYLSKIGLKLGKKILVKEKLNFDNSLLIKIDNKQINISNKLASNVFIDLN